MDDDTAYPGISKRILTLLIERLLLPAHEVIRERAMETQSHPSPWSQPLMIPT